MTDPFGQASSPRTDASLRREVMSSFRKTLLRWYSTVEVLMNSRAAISLLVAPAAARLATCALADSGLSLNDGQPGNRRP